MRLDCSYIIYDRYGGDDRDRTYCDRSRKIYSLLPYHYGGISMFGTRYRIRTGVNAVKGHYPRPLDEPSKKGRATVAGPSVSLPREVSRRCGSQNWRS